MEENNNNQLKILEQKIDQFKLAAEMALKEGEAHLRSFNQASEKFQQEVVHGCKRLEKVATFATSQITEASKLIALDDYKQLSVENARNINEISVSMMDRVSSMISWFHWQRIWVAMLVAIVSCLVTSYFVTDSWPWQSREQIKLERNAGRTLLKAWPYLSDVEKTDIKQAADTVKLS